MQSKAELLQNLALYWHSADQDVFDFINIPTSKNDVEEIIDYNEAIISSAVSAGKITGQQAAACLENLSKIATALTGKKQVPFLKKAIAALGPAKLLQGLLVFSDSNAQAMLKLANRLEKKVIELTASQSAAPVTFFFKQLHGNTEFYDNLLEYDLPVNGNAEFNCYDNYLPLYKLFQKYLPDTPVRLVIDESELKGNYIYTVTFKVFEAFAVTCSNNLLSIVPSEILEDCRLGKALLIYNDLDGPTHFSPTADKLQQQISKAGIEDAFFLLSGDWGNKHLQKCKGEGLHLYIMDYFEEAMAYSVQQHSADYSYASRVNILTENTSTIKHFICLNKMVKSYRLYLSYFFHSNKLLHIVHVSQNNVPGLQAFKADTSHLNALWRNVDETAFEKFRLELPWTIDYDDIQQADWDAVPVNIINDSFCWIVTETSFNNILSEQSFRLTEKTYKPIAFFMPFIMVAEPFTLRELQKQGYKTFSAWWDESYDSIVDPIERMKKITETITSISKLSRPQLLSMYQQMQDVLEHNHRRFINTTSGKTAMQAINTAYKALV